MNKKLIFTLLITLSATASVLSQGRGSGGQGKMSNFTGTVKGSIIDAETNAPVEYANIVFHSVRDSSMVTGGITNEDGLFSVSKVPAGRYFAKAKFIGYNTTSVETFSVNPKNPIVNMGDIELQPASENLEAVTVTGQKQMLTHNLDKKAYNVGSDINAEGGSALEIMETIPSVEVDMEGNVSLRGSQNVTILVDGRPSTYSSIEEIPANIIETVEVITNPSARYDPDGLSGIINIVLKKRRDPGYHGMVMLNAGTGDKYMSTLNFNYREDKFNFFTNLSYRQLRMTGETISDRRMTNGDDDLTSLLQQNQDFRRGGDFISARGGVDYFINDASTLTLSGGYNSRDFVRWDITQTETDVYLPSTTSDLYYREDDGDSGFSSYNMALNYTLNGNGNGRELTADVFFNRWDGLFKSDLTQWWEETTNPEISEQSIDDFATSILTFQTDLVHPVGNGGRIETGLKGIIRTQDSDFTFYNIVDDNQNEDDNRSNWFIYDEQQYSAYAIYSNTFADGKLSYQGGLRVEQAFTKANQRAMEEEPIDREFLNWFPSAHIRWNISDKNSAQVAYSKRVSRPSTRLLNPFVNYSDPLNRSTGNPWLNPEFTNSFEISYSHTLPKTRFSASTYYRNTTDIISRYVEIETDETEGYDYAMSTFRNIDESETVGLEGVVTQTVTPWWKVNASANYNYIKLYADYLDKESSEGDNWTTRATSTFSIGKNLELQLTGNYRSPSLSVGGSLRFWQSGGGQGKTEEMYWFDLGMRLNVLNRKGTITLRVSDILNTMKYEALTWGPNFTSNMERTRESRIIWLGFSYRINEYRSRRERRPDDIDMDFD